MARSTSIDQPTARPGHSAGSVLPIVCFRPTSRKAAQPRVAAREHVHLSVQQRGRSSHGCDERPIADWCLSLTCLLRHVLDCPDNARCLVLSDDDVGVNLHQSDIPVRSGDPKDGMISRLVANGVFDQLGQPEPVLREDRLQHLIEPEGPVLVGIPIKVENRWRPVDGFRQIHGERAKPVADVQLAEDGNGIAAGKATDPCRSK